jgi:hypothetical protein
MQLRRFWVGFLLIGTRMWKAVSHFVNMREVLLLGAHPGWVQMGNIDAAAEKAG